MKGGIVLIMPTKKSSDGNQPATQKDLETWGGALTVRIDGLEKRIGGLELRMDRLEKIAANTFDLVQSIDQQLKEWKHIPDRVDKHDRWLDEHDREIARLKQKT